MSPQTPQTPESGYFPAEESWTEACGFVRAAVEGLWEMKTLILEFESRAALAVTSSFDRTTFIQTQISDAFR